MSPEIDDTTKDITITLSGAVPTPKASIVNISAPPEAGYGSSVHIDVQLKNVGGAAGKLFAYIKDTDTGQVVGTKGYTPSLAVNASGHLIWDLLMPNKDWYLTVTAGHVE